MKLLKLKDLRQTLKNEFKLILTYFDNRKLSL